MAATPEALVKKKVVELLKKYEVYYFFPAANGYGRTSIPDLICCWHGAFIAIECKAGKGRTTALQDRELERIRSAGGTAVVVRDTDVGLFEKFLKNAVITGEAK